MPDGILARVPHEIARYNARVGKKQRKKKRGREAGVIHVKLKSWLRPLGLTVPYLNVNLFSCFLRYSWLARPAFNTATFMSSSVWFGWLKWAGTGRSFLPLPHISAAFSKTVRQSASSLPNVHYRWTLGAQQAINHVFSDAGKMSRDVNMPFGCCNCGWWINMGTCAANGPVTRESTWWLVWKVSR